MPGLLPSANTGQQALAQPALACSLIGRLQKGIVAPEQKLPPFAVQSPSRREKRSGLGSHKYAGDGAGRVQGQR
jgi:hypothetical protein